MTEMLETMLEKISHKFSDVIESIGFKKILGLRTHNAIGLALAINRLFVLLANIFIR